MAHSEDRKAEVLAVLAANGGNVLRTARKMGLPEATVRKWKNGEVPATVAEKCEEKKRSIADALEAIIWQVLGILPDKLPGASVHELNGTLKLSAETRQLLRGEPTSIQEHRGDFTEDECADHAAALLQQARDRRAAAVADPGGTGGTRQPPAVN
jgi:hypothetical protein